MNEGNKFQFDLWLYNEMQKRKLNTMDMERLTGIAHSTISNYLHNKWEPSLYLFGVILAAFGKHIEIVDD